MDFESVSACLTQRGMIPYAKREIDHGRQLRVGTGETVNFYSTGKVVVGGPKTPLKQELEAWKLSGLTPVPVAPEGALAESGYRTGRDGEASRTADLV